MFLTLIVIIVVLSILIFIHELGHFFSARKAGVAIEEFGIGFPPRLISLKKKETIYSINLIPIGGFVKIKGESGDDKADKDSFSNKSFWQKIFILGSGVAMNIILAIFLLSIGFMVGLPTVIDDEQNLPKNLQNQKIQIASVYEKSAADLAGIVAGDTILEIDGQQFNKVSEMQGYIQTNQDQTLSLEIERGKEKLIKGISPIALEDNGDEKVLGVLLVSTGIINYNFFESIYQGVITTFVLLGKIIVSFYLLIKGTISLNNVSGPVGVMVITSQISKLGLIYVLQFTAILSLNLAIINILPFPALDGGRIVFVIIEKFRGKPNNEKVESLIHNLGFSLLIFFLIFITYKDFIKYSEQIFGKLKNIF